MDPAGTENERFARAVAQLHANILGGYSDWCEAVELPERVPEVEFLVLAKNTRAPVSAAARMDSVCCRASGFHTVPAEARA